MAASAYYQVVQQIYVSYFGRPADPVGLANFAAQLDAAGAPLTLKDIDAAYADNTTIKTLIDQFGSSTESNTLYAGASTAAFVNAIYSNILNRPADYDGLVFWSSAIDRGVITRAKAALSIMSGALNDTSAQGQIDAAVVTNKIQVATSFTTNLNTTTEVLTYAGDAAAATARAMLSSVTNTTDTTTFDVDATITTLGTQGTVGSTFTLTTGADTVTGTAGNDTITGVLSATAANKTFGALDVINGGDGTDTLNILDETGGQTIPGTLQMSNVETVNVRSAAAATIDLTGSGISGVTTLNSTQSGAATLATAATTDVNVSGATGAIDVAGGKNVTVSDATVNTNINVGESGAGSTNAAGTITVTDTKQGSGNIEIDGGTNVTVTATSTADTGTIKVGVTTAASGAVAVTSNLSGDGTATLDQGDITVKGGSTVTVASNLTVTAKDQAAGAAHTFGDVLVTGNGTTTSVTVNQTYTETEFTKAAVAVVKELHTVTFKALASGETTTVDGLTFTASKALTAAEVAQAFSNLAASDTQTAGGPVANGVFTGALSGNFTSGAASGAVVVFTAKDESRALSLTAGVVDPTEVVVAGTAASGAVTSTNSVTYGAVRVDGNATASITTVSVDGYGSADLGTTGTDLNALTTLSLANSHGAAQVATSATTLGLTVNKVNDAVDLDQTAATIKTLNVTATGANSTFGLTAAAVETLTVAGDKVLDIDTGSTLTALKTVTVSGSAGLSIDASGANVTSVNTTATTGTVTATIDASKATYTGGAGVDAVTVTAATLAKTISLGAGNDSLTLTGATLTGAWTASGGDGTDTLVMGSAQAAAASATNVFEGKIDGFDHLKLGASAAAETVNLDNMDDISYVISANGASVATTETSAITFQGLVDGQSVTVAGLTLTANQSMTNAEVASAFASHAAGYTGAGYAGKGVFSGTLALFGSGAATGADVTFTSGTATSNVADIVTSSSGVAAPTAVVVTDSADVTESAAVTFVNAAQNETITVAGRVLTVNDAGGMTAAEIEAAFATGAAAKGTFTGALAGWTATGGNGNDGDGILTFTSTTANVSVTDIVVSDTAAGGNVSAATTQGYASESVAFQALAIGQSVTAGGITLQATAAMTSAEVAAVFGSVAAGAAGNATAKGTVTGTLDTSWASEAAGGSTVEFRTVNAAAGYGVDETDLNQASAGVAAPTALVVSTTQGNDGTGSGTLTISNMANDGTLELNAAGSGVTVSMKDATGTSDSFHFVLDVVSADLNFGNNTVASVETISITADDTKLDDNGDGVNDPVETATFKLTDTAAKTVNVDGDAHLSLDISASTAITTVNAANLTGSLTVTATGAAAVTVTGGSAADTLTAAGSSDVLLGGAGADVLTGADLTTLTGGAGNDIFMMNKPSNVNSYSSITDLTAGDVIDLDAANAGTVVFTKSAVTLASTAVFQDYANAAANALGTDANDAAWFQFGGNTYIVQSGNTTANNDFVNGSDSIIQIVGLVDLSTASYNQSIGTLEIV